MLTIGIENQKVSFQEAIDKQYEVIQKIVKSNLFTDVKIDKKTIVSLKEVTKERLKQIVSKDIKKYLSDPSDINSSRIGYDVWLVAKCGGKPANISIRFGTPNISGKDNVNLNVNDAAVNENYNEIMSKFYYLTLDLIELLDPLNVIYFDYDLRNKINNDEIDYGLIMYKQGNQLRELPNAKDIKMDQLPNGLLWKADFSSYENGCASVIETWGLNR